MYLSLTPVDVDPLFSGFTWEVADLDGLAKLVAELLVVHHEHVLRVIQGGGSDTPIAKESVIRSVLDHKLRRPANEQAKYQRDGLLFQHLAWIAAAHARERGDLFSAPHIRLSDKGQDMVIVHAGHDVGSVAAVTICEDKATENCRATIRNKVLPEIEVYESGARDDELESQTLAILEQHHDKARAQELIQGVFWNQARRYRVTITVDEAHDHPVGRKRLFKGYDHAARGDKSRRRGETIRIPELREWFDSFAAKVHLALQTMLEVHDV